MREVKRVRVGMTVQTDLTGTGDWVVGIVEEANDRRVKLDVPGESEEVWVSKKELFKATQAEYKAYCDKVNGDDQGEATEKTEEGTPEPIEPPAESKKADGKPVMYGDAELDRRVKDAISQKFNGINLDGQYQMAAAAFKELGVKEHGDMKTTIKGMKERWGHLNNGQQRMIMGNCLKKYLKKVGEVEALKIVAGL